MFILKKYELIAFLKSTIKFEENKEGELDLISLSDIEQGSSVTIITIPNKFF